MDRGLLEDALVALYTPDQHIIDQAQDVIINFQKQPDGILIFLDIVKNSPDVRVRYSAITNTLHLVEGMWRNIPEPVQSRARNEILDIIGGDLTPHEFSMMADISSIIFRAMGFWNEIVRFICVAYQEQKHELTMLFLSKIFPVMPDAIIQSSYQAFKNMAYFGLQVQDQATNHYAASIFIFIIRKVNDQSLLEPLIQYLMPEIANSLASNDYFFSDSWKLVRGVMKIKGIDNSVIMELFKIAINFISDNNLETHKRLIILDAFAPIVPLISFEMLNVMLSLSFVLALTYITEDNELPDEYFTILKKALIFREDEVADFVKNKVSEYFNMNESYHNVVLALCILHHLLKYSPDVLVSDLDFILRVFQTSLSTNNELIQLAALIAIEVCNESFEEISDILLPLMQCVMPFLIAPSRLIRNTSANAFLSLCDLCDTEIEGLFKTLWELQNKIHQDSNEDYILIVAQVIRLSQDINDEMQAQILGFVNNIFEKPEYSVEKAVSLSIISALFSKNSSLHEEILPKIVPILNESLSYSNDDTICQSLAFITNLVKLYRKEVLPFVSNYFNIILSILDMNNVARRYFLSAMNTACSIIKFCNNSDLLGHVTEIILKLSMNSDINTMTSVCDFIAMISKQLAEAKFKDLPIITETLVNIIRTKSDQVLLDSAFEAISKVLKRCRTLDPNYFDKISQELINDIFSGNIKLFGGNPQKLFDVSSEFAQYLLSFIDVYLRNQPPNANEIYGILLQWMSKADEITIVPIIGAISEIMKNTDIDVQVLTNFIQLLQNISGNASNIQLRQNISYFLSTLLSKYPDQIQLVFQFVPILSGWWEEGKTKAIGYQTCLSNIAVLFLRIYILVNQVPQNIIAEAVRAFPPADETETENMAQLISQIISNSNLMSPDIYKSACISISNLLTKSKSSKNIQKISPETYSNLENLFKTMISGNASIKEELLGIYSKNQMKQQIISQYF